MPGQRDVPCRRRHTQLVESGSGETHERRRSRNERDAKPGADERDDREQLVGLLHDPWCEPCRRAHAQHVIVEARGSGPRDDDEWLGRHRPQPGARVPAATRPERGDQALVEDVPHLQPVVRGAMTDEADVDLAADQRVDLIGRRHVAKMELNVGMGAAKTLHHIGQQSEDTRHAKADAKKAGFASRRPLGERQRGGRLDQQMTAAAREQPPRLRQLHVAIAADQQRTSDPRFHAADPLAERRLRHVQAIGGPAEMQRLGQDEQRPEIVELHVHNQRLSDGAERFIGQNRTGRAILRPGDTSPMIDVNWSAAIGTAGTACSALSFLPQFLKVRRQGGRGLSAAMLALLLAGGGLWLAYGLLNGATAVIVANTAVLILVSAVAGLKVIHATRARRLERRPRIAIDMDDVMADALAEHLRRYNAAYGAN